jgi:hypothetical protein
MNLKDLSVEELARKAVCEYFHFPLGREDYEAELLSRLSAGQTAIEAMELIYKLWQANLTQDEFDKQLVIILLKYKEYK